jgi:hypothetical protein
MMKKEMVNEKKFATIMGKPSKKSITLLLALYSLHYENSNV